MTSRRRLAAVLAVAALLRLPRPLLRWDETSWLYAAYDAPTVEALAEGRFADALAFTGLHPPLYPLLHAALELLAPVPLLLLSLSALLSWLAVLVVARRSALAGLLLACGPVQIAYAAELNGYPLAVLAVAATWVAREGVAAGRVRWIWLAAAGVLAAWSHALAGLSAGIAALTLGRRGLPVLALMALGVAPLLPGASELAEDPGSFRQPPFELELILADARARFGLGWLLLVPLWLLGAPRAPALAIGAGGTWVAILALQLAGVAAPHQFPYYVLLGPPLALLAAAAARPGWTIAAAAWCGLATLFADLRAARVIHEDLATQRAIDLALDEAPADAALYLLSPPLSPDDDKRATSPVLWRFPPWRPMPMVRPYEFAYDDHRHGQPRRIGERVVYLNDWPRPPIREALAAHGRLWIVVSEPGERRAYTDELAEALGGELRRVGEDALIVAGR